MTLYARKDEEITCENGHVICRMARDVTIGTLQMPAVDFKEWQQRKPNLGEPLQMLNCVKCNAIWVRDSNRYHFKDGWR